mmetsp:Transcript_49772/g.131966  ORF Transcript_49772/g.131966 Transcript_49772/m.131966 type:complete len:242 (+) Transcript_49772:206-931(+)
MIRNTRATAPSPAGKVCCLMSCSASSLSAVLSIPKKPRTDRDQSIPPFCASSTNISRLSSGGRTKRAMGTESAVTTRRKPGTGKTSSGASGNHGFSCPVTISVCTFPQRSCGRICACRSGMRTNPGKRGIFCMSFRTMSTWAAGSDLVDALEELVHLAMASSPDGGLAKMTESRVTVPATAAKTGNEEAIRTIPAANNVWERSSTPLAPRAVQHATAKSDERQTMLSNTCTYGLRNINMMP